MTYEEIISKVSEDLGMPKQLVDKTYRAFWKAVRLYIQSLPLKEDLTDEEFLNFRPNVNIPSIGKLYVTLKRYQGMKKHFEMHYKNYKGNKYKNNTKSNSNA